ncbi:TetR/AcrR family transcriptional regulator [Roseibium sediminis]|uniref:TetR/AcrR family transcriptional regulator n=1 Tax=Roseibium sediminis TaxID=1775174 RepID=UPI0013761514|nr:TetR/AcrR family transcriptional regulator [Roseibium sediminis]
MVEKENRKPGRPRTFDKLEALDKVIHVFWELGYDAADTETLSKRTGFSKPSLYKAFGSKEDMFVAALNRYRETRSPAALDALTNAPSPKEGLREFFRCFAADVAGPGHPCGCLIMSVAISLRDRLPKVAAALQEMPQDDMARMSTYFSQQVDQGRLPKTFDSNAAIALMRDLGAAMAVMARSGVPLEALENKASRNANLVLLEGAGVQPNVR